MMFDTLLLALGWLGTGLAALFAAVLLSRTGTGERWLGAGFTAAAVASGLVIASHSGFATAALEGAEVAATLAAGPLVLLWATQVIGRPFRPWVRAAWFVPAVGWAGLTIAGAPAAADADAIRWAVLLQMGCTAAAAALARGRWRSLGVGARRLLGSGLGGLGILHLVQLLRMAAPRVTPANLVPASIGCLLAGLAFVALRRSRLRLGSDDGDAELEREAADLVARLDRWLVDESGLRERSLTVAAAAQRLGSSPARLSRAVNRRTGRSFTEHVAAARVAEARRLLADARLAHLAVEAIGERAGFGSRSVFFAEFRRRTGQSPAEFRQREGTDVRERVSGPTSDRETR